jgi:50S ribosomal protein L16 3-hydroxylase
MGGLCESDTFGPMLAGWLDPTEADDFVARHLGKQPYARPGTATSALPLLAWETFDRVLASDQPLDVLTVARGRLVKAPCPTSLADVRTLLSHGVSVVIRGSERNDPGLASLAESFGRSVPGEVHVQLYATPAGTNSYGWHYDFEEVFIAQTAGVKDYFFRDNTVARDTVLGQALDFGVFRRETSPLLSARLVPGDWLYLPSRWWHLVTCVADSLSISVGVMPPHALETAVRLPAGWTGTGA